MLSLHEYFKDGKVSLRPETFAVVKSRESCPGAFANIVAPNETTVVIESSKVRQEHVIAMEQDWRLLTFEMELPFDLFGFIATVAAQFAEARIVSLIIAAYSTDHVLVKNDHLPKALSCLERLGVVVEVVS